MDNCGPLPASPCTPCTPSTPYTPTTPTTPTSPSEPYIAMKRTKLSVTQIKHALPGWLFQEIMSSSKSASPRRQTLLRSIAALPPALQATFEDLRKERKHAMMTNNLVRQRDTEKAMWDRLNGYLAMYPHLLDQS